MRRRKPEPDLFALRCETCDTYLWRTQNGYLCCPFGHGGLIEQQDEPPEVDEASLFDASDLDTGMPAA